MYNTKSSISPLNSRKGDLNRQPSKLGADFSLYGNGLKGAHAQAVKDEPRERLGLAVGASCKIRAMTTFAFAPAAD